MPLDRWTKLQPARPEDLDTSPWPTETETAEKPYSLTELGKAFKAGDREGIKRGASIFYSEQEPGPADRRPVTSENDFLLSGPQKTFPLPPQQSLADVLQSKSPQYNMMQDVKTITPPPMRGEVAGPLNGSTSVEGGTAPELHSSGRSFNSLATSPDTLPTGRSFNSLSSMHSPGQPVEGGVTGEKWYQHPGAKEGLMTLLGTGIAGLFGGTAAASGAAQAGGQFTMERLRQDQMEHLQRRQMAMEDAYKQAQLLPQDILLDPKYKDLVAAQQAVLQSVGKGDVANEKAISQFLTQRALFAGDLQKMQEQREIDAQTRAREAEHGQTEGWADAANRRVQEAIENPAGARPEDRFRASQTPPGYQARPEYGGARLTDLQNIELGEKAKDRQFREQELKQRGALGWGQINATKERFNTTQGNMQLRAGASNLQRMVTQGMQQGMMSQDEALVQIAQPLVQWGEAIGMQLDNESVPGKIVVDGTPYEPAEALKLIYGQVLQAQRVQGGVQQ